MAERNEKGQFVKGNSAGKQFTKNNDIGKDTRFKAGNTVAAKYKAEYADRMLAYFREHSGYPQFEEFADLIGVSIGTLKNWADTRPRFAAIRERCAEIQCAKLNTGALMGRFDSSYAKFIAVNHHGLRDKMTAEVENVRPFEISLSVIDGEEKV